MRVLFLSLVLVGCADPVESTDVDPDHMCEQTASPAYCYEGLDMCFTLGRESREHLLGQGPDLSWMPVNESMQIGCVLGFHEGWRSL